MLGRGEGALYRNQPTENVSHESDPSDVGCDFRLPCAWSSAWRARKTSRPGWRSGSPRSRRARRHSTSCPSSTPYWCARARRAASRRCHDRGGAL